MKLSFEQALIEVWRQTLVEKAKAVELGLSVTLFGVSQARKGRSGSLYPYKTAAEVSFHCFIFRHFNPISDFLLPALVKICFVDK